MNNKNGIIFIYKSNLHEGLIGIIASRIKEYFNKPCIVLTNSNNNFDVLVKIKSNKLNNKSSIELEIIDLIKKIE